MSAAGKKRGRPIGTGHPIGPQGPKVGSRPWKLMNMRFGERIFFEVGAGTTTSRLMQQISSDIQRNGLAKTHKQSGAFAIVPATREMIELVIVTRAEADTGDDLIPALKRFYCVSSDADLIVQQERHIRKLQEDLQPIKDESNQRARIA